MAAMIQIFIDVITILWTFVQNYLIPTTVADINLIHVAIWTPVVIGLLTMVIGFAKSMWARRK